MWLSTVYNTACQQIGGCRGSRMAKRDHVAINSPQQHVSANQVLNKPIEKLRLACFFLSFLHLVTSPFSVSHLDPHLSFLMATNTDMSCRDCSLHNISVFVAGGLLTFIIFHFLLGIRQLDGELGPSPTPTLALSPAVGGSVCSCADGVPFLVVSWAF